MWHQIAPNPPHTCISCGRSGAEVGPFLEAGVLRSPMGLQYERSHSVYVCRKCFVVAMCHPQGPLPELDPQTFDGDMADLRQAQSLISTVAADITAAKEHIAHLERVVADYEEREEQRPAPAEIDVDALAAAVVDRMAALAPPPAETPAPAAPTRTRRKAAA